MLSGKWFPFLLLIIMVFAYAVQVPGLGYYLDDWIYVASFDQGGEEALLSYGINDSRPFALWVFSQFFKVLGTGVLQWQLITLFWRFSAALASFFLLKTLWPNNKKSVGIISLLFGVFPFFKHQPMSIAYFNVLMQYFVILLSFCFTAEAIQTKNIWIKCFLFILSYISSLFNLLCLEYYLSLEFIRIIIIFLMTKKSIGSGRTNNLKIIGRTFIACIPYAVIFAAGLYYRFVFVPKTSADVRAITIFSRYHGIHLFFHLLSLFLQYLSESILGIWYRSINPLELDLNMRNAQIGLGLGVLGGILLLYLLQKTDMNSPLKSQYEMFLFGIAAMLLGFLPGMAQDVSPSANYTYHDRYLLPSFWGISIFTVTGLLLFLKSRVLQNILYSGMICLSIFFQIQNSFMYRYSWKYQQQFQWNMKWRVPDLAKNTAVFGDGVIASFMGGWADSSMLIEMYGKNNGINPTPYWYFNSAEDNYLSWLEAEAPVYIKSKMYFFETEPDNVLIITKPEDGKCAWVLDEADAFNPYLESGIGNYIPYQNKSRIIPDSDYVMPEPVFGTDYIHNWCYYFEKADLAFDQKRYDYVLELFDEAENAKIAMGNPTEMRPFIKAAAFSGKWEKALAWSEAANTARPEKTDAYFLNLWKIIDRDTPASEAKSAAVSKAFEIFSDNN